ncbi:MAG: lipoate--protein ligase family protein, partial [Candidatus Hodarchaeales archaeon]
TEWDIMILNGIDSINTQTIWHAASLARSKGIQTRDLIIIHWPTYPIVSCGYHQVIERVVDLNYCHNNDITVCRRVCGGGAVLLDENQIFFAIVAHTDSTIIPRRINSFFKKALEPVVQTYQHFGIDAYYKPVNDIMVNDRKISGNGAGILEDAQFLVGNFILDFPRKEMANILKVPSEKFRDKVVQSLEAGISSFKDELGYIPSRESIIQEYMNQVESSFGVHLNVSEFSPDTIKLTEELRKTYLTEEWLYQVKDRGKHLTSEVKIHGSSHVVEGMHKSTGGLITVNCEFDNSILVGILISGDFWIYPDTILPQLEQHLANTDIVQKDLTFEIQNFFTANQCETPGTSASDLAQAIQNAYNNLNTK